MQKDPITPPELQRIFLLPGEYHITKKPKYLATLLGSCVAVCIFNQENGSAAMNHFLHDVSNEIKEKEIGRYGNLSTRYLIDTLFSLDPKNKNYQAKIFGGGSVVSHLGVGMGIGKKNVDIAKEILNECGIPIVESNVGGKSGMKIYFNTNDFSVAVRTVGQETKDFSSRNIRVLVVDDSAMVRTILCDLINETPGMEVVAEAADAFEARDKMLSLNPDVISLDVIMPKVDGLKFLQKIMRFKPTPVVIVSTIAKDKSEIEQKAKKLGAVGVIDKDKLEIYKGFQVAQRNYIPMLRTAARHHFREKVN